MILLLVVTFVLTTSGRSSHEDLCIHNDLATCAFAMIWENSNWNSFWFLLALQGPDRAQLVDDTVYMQQ